MTWIVLLLSIVVTGVATAQTSGTKVGITKTVEPATGPIPSGQPFIYTIAYNWQDGAPGSLIIEDALPAALEFISATTVSSGTQLHSYQQIGSTIRFTITGPDLLATSGGGTVQINVRFPQGKTCNGTSAINRAQIRTERETRWVISNPVTVTASAINKWVFSKDVYEACTVDSSVVYKISMYNPGGYGILDMNNVRLYDAYSGDASISLVSQSPNIWTGITNGQITPAQPVIAATFGPNWYVVYVKVKYPRPTFSAGQWVTNAAYIDYQLPCDTARRRTSDKDSSRLCDAQPSGSASFVKYMLMQQTFPWNVSYLPSLVPGCCQQYAIEYRNNGNVPHNNAKITDAIPAEVDVSRVFIDVPVFSGNTNDVTLKLWRGTGGVCIAELTTVTFTSSQWYTIPSGLPVCKVELSYSDPVPVGARMWLFLDFCVRFNNRVTGAAVAPGQTITNTATLTASSLGGAINIPASTSHAVDALGPKFILSKQFIGRCASPGGANPNGPFFPGDVVRYRIAIANVGNAAASGLVISDMLPTYVKYLGNAKFYYAAHTSQVTLTNPACTDPPMRDVANLPIALPTLQPTAGAQSLTWSFPSLPNRCDGTPEFLVIDFDVTISSNPPAPYGQYHNTFSVTATNHPATLTSPLVTFVVNRIVAFTVKKEVREKGSGTAFATSASLPIGSTAEYRLTVLNTGNATLKDVCLLDIMPHVGDISVIGTTPTYSTRGSALEMPLDAAVAITPTTGFDAVYLGPPLNSTRPNRLSFCGSFCAPASGVVNPTNPAPLVNTVSSSFASTYSFSVQAQSTTLLQPGQALEVIATAKVPATASVGDAACNSFAVKLGDDRGACMRTEASACISVIAPLPPADKSDCIDFEDTVVGYWRNYNVDEVSAYDEGDPYGTVLKIEDGSGGSIAVNDAEFRGNWLEDTDAACLCFDYKVDWNGGVNTVSVTAPKLTIYTGAPIMDVTDMPSRLFATFIGDPLGDVVVDDEWKRYCLPVGPSVNDVIPSNAFGSWRIVDNGSVLTGAAAAAAWDQIITGVTGMVLYADYNSDPSELVYFDNFCWKCDEPPVPAADCCDSVSVSPGDHYDVQISKLIVTVHNKRPTPIDYIEVEYKDCATGQIGTPLQINSGSLQAISDAPPTTYMFPYAAYNLDPSNPPPYVRVPLSGYSLTPAGTIIRQDRIVWHLSANVADPTTWCITLKIHHVGGEVCIEQLEPWKPSADLAAITGVTRQRQVTEPIYAISLGFSMPIVGRSAAFATISVLDSNDGIVGGTGGVWEGASVLDTPMTVRGFVQSRHSARFSLNLSNPKHSQVMAFVRSRDTGRRPRCIIRLYDTRGQLLASDTSEAGSMIGRADPTEGPAPGHSDVALTSIAPNPASHSVTFSFAITSAGNARIELADAKGNMVAIVDEGHRASGTHQITHDVSTLPSGVYFVRVITKTGRVGGIFEVVR